MTALIQTYLGILISITATFANECNFPSNWREGKGTYLLGLVQNTNITNYIQYKFDKSAVSARSSNPSLKTYQYNCPAYESFADGTQRFLRASLGQQQQVSGLCVEQKWKDGILVRREAGNQSNLRDCQSAVSGKQNYTFLLPVQVNANGKWSFAKEVDCPLPSGYYGLSCQLNGGEVCPPESRGTVLKQINQTTKSISILAPDVYEMPSNKHLPLTGTIKCIANLDATVLGESSEDKVSLMMWTTLSQPGRIYLYTARYRRLDNGTYSVSMDVTNPDVMDAWRGATHASHQLHQPDQRNYIKLHFSPISISTTRTPVAPTQSPTAASTPAPTAEPVVYYVQTVVTAIHDSYARKSAKANGLRDELSNRIVEICGIDSARVKTVYLEKGAQGKTLATFQIEEGTPSVEACRENVQQYISAGQSFNYENQALHLQNTMFVWTAKGICPNIMCPTDSSCWVRQGVYACECDPATKDGLGSCPTAVTSLSGSPNKNQIITFSVVGVAVVLVIIAIVVVVVIRRRRAKDTASDQDSIGSLEQQDRDMYSSIGKKPTAFHDKSFIVDDDDASDHGEKTGIHSSAYM